MLVTSFGPSSFVKSQPYNPDPSFRKQVCLFREDKQMEPFQRRQTNGASAYGGGGGGVEIYAFRLLGGGRGA